MDWHALMQPPDLFSARSVLAIAPHPDDIEVGIGGTIALLADRGVHVSYLTLTDGAAGSSDPALIGPLLHSIRRKELQQSGSILGVAEFHWLDLPDTGLAQIADLTAQIVTTVRTVRPDALLTMDPWLPYEMHPDHRAAGFACVDAFCMSGIASYNPVDLARELQPHQCQMIAYYGTHRPNTKVAIDSVFERKVAAILAHESQFSGEGAEFIKAFTAFQGVFGKDADTLVVTPDEPTAYAELIKVLHSRQSHYNTQAEWM